MIPTQCRSSVLFCISLGGFQSLSGPTTSHGLAKSLTTTWDIGLFILTFTAKEKNEGEKNTSKLQSIDANH